MISEKAMYWYNTTKSEWIDYVGRSRKVYDNNMVVAVVHYTNQKGYTNGDLYFWVSLEEYENLKNAESVGSIYYWEWSMYWSPKAWYAHQEDKQNDDDTSSSNEGEVGSPTYDYSAMSFFGADSQREIANQNYIDGATLHQARNRINNGTFDDWLISEDYSREERDAILSWVQRMYDAEELLEWATELKEGIAIGKLTWNKSMKMFVKDIESLFGVSIKQEVFYQFMSQMSPSGLNPTTWIRNKQKISNLYYAMERDGLNGAAMVGKRMLSAKNPFIRNRRAYRTLKDAKTTGEKIFRSNWLEGEEAQKAIRRLHKKAIRENATQIIKRNSLNLEKRYVEKGGKKVLQVRWYRNISKQRKIFNWTKRAVRLSKWAFFL